MLIAICKCAGTLAPTLIGVIEQNMFIVATGVGCFVLDVLYISFSIRCECLRRDAATRIPKQKERHERRSFSLGMI